MKSELAIMSNPVENIFDTEFAVGFSVRTDTQRKTVYVYYLIPDRPQKNVYVVVLFLYINKSGAHNYDLSSRQAIII